jgi:hypothetical protein
MSQIQPGVLIGAEGRYLRRYDSLGLMHSPDRHFFLAPRYMPSLRTVGS